MTLDREITAFEEQKAELEKHYASKFVVFKDGKLQGAYDSMEAAAAFAVSQFGRGPYLIRQVGVSPPPLPASVMYRSLISLLGTPNYDNH